jgi:hypothetical protein
LPPLLSTEEIASPVICRRDSGALPFDLCGLGKG